MFADAMQGVGELNSTLTAEQQKRRDCFLKTAKLQPKRWSSGEGSSHNKLKSKENQRV
jgi:hypothetical protein